MSITAKIALALIVFLKNILTKHISKVKDFDTRIVLFLRLYSAFRKKDFSKVADILECMFGNHSLFRMRSNDVKIFLSAVFQLEYVLKKKKIHLL